MALKTICNKMASFLEAIQKDLEKASEGNKAAAQRVRKNTIALAKVAKEYRKESVKAAKSGALKRIKKVLKKKAPAKRKAPAKKKAAPKRKVAAKRKAPAKKKAAPKRKVAAKRKAPAKRKAATKRKTTTRKTATRKRATAKMPRRRATARRK